MHDVALGTKIFMRDEKLKNLLQSVEESGISKVYVADDGKETPQKASIYDADYEFDLEVIDLEYDAGLGRGRNEIVKRLAEEYLLLVDSDHKVPQNVSVLRRILQQDPQIGGVAGNIIEPDQGRYFQNAKDIFEEGGDLVRKFGVSDRDIRFVAGYPFVEFDFIPNAALFRAECVEEYSWDPEYVIGHEHVDFYVGHWKRTDWTFGICPSVAFPHYPGGSAEYVSNRHDSEKIERDKNHFLDKWGYDDLRMETMYWFDTHQEQPPILERARSVYNQYGMAMLMKRALLWGKQALSQNFSSVFKLR